MLKVGDNVFMGPPGKQGIVTEVLAPRRVEVTTVEGEGNTKEICIIRKQNNEDKDTARKATDEVCIDIAELSSNEFSPYCTRSGRDVKQFERLNL
ncbi:hypothetical protein NPIL_701511 [Nephila pilipes]|uniref:Uncharacterized protein n=1 Tax=Nephila pilipes TaxID=299642 RepID=A0A8X6UCY9_NEPPI|nr:hypothetical protein NPIL_701511 [Nephila pilipes]